MSAAARSSLLQGAGDVGRRAPVAAAAGLPSSRLALLCRRLARAAEAIGEDEDHDCHRCQTARTGSRWATEVDAVALVPDGGVDRRLAGGDGGIGCAAIVRRREEDRCVAPDELVGVLP